MKPTLELPDDLMRDLELDVKENRKLKDTVAELLRRGLSRESAASSRRARRVELPLVRCAHEAKPEVEMTPERVAEVLLAQESEGVRGSLR